MNHSWVQFSNLRAFLRSSWDCGAAWVRSRPYVAELIGLDRDQNASTDIFPLSRWHFGKFTKKQRGIITTASGNGIRKMIKRAMRLNPKHIPLVVYIFCVGLMTGYRSDYPNPLRYRNIRRFHFTGLDYKKKGLLLTPAQ